jgi:hypothetical protein
MPTAPITMKMRQALISIARIAVSPYPRYSESAPLFSHQRIFCYRLSHIALKRSLLIEGNFGLALSTYLHEIAHMFGHEGPASFSKALTELLEIALCHTQIIELYREQWQKL